MFGLQQFCAMNIRHVLPYMILILGAFSGCSVSEANGGTGNLVALSPPDRPCGSPLLLSVRGEGPSLGVFEVMNDTHNLWISFNHTARFQLERISTYIGSGFDIPRKDNGVLDADKFAFQSKSPSRVGKWSQSISLENLTECMTLVVRVELKDLEAENGKSIVRGWAHSGRDGEGFTFPYCKQSCFWTSRCDGVGDGQFVTVPVEAWLDSKKEYARELEAKYDLLFPHGLEVGCNTEIRLESSEEIIEMLRHSGDPRSLEKDYFGDPGQIRNDFANELCALAVTIALDERVPDFCPSEEKIISLEVSQGAFKGWTIAEVFNEANTVLGGCTSNYSAFQMVEVLANINQNFKKDQADGGFLLCPEEGI